MATAVAFAACRILRHFSSQINLSIVTLIAQFFFSESRDRLSRCSSMLVAFVSWRRQGWVDDELGEGPLQCASGPQIQVGFTHLVLIPEGLTNNGIVAIQEN